jgi:hypothetical protein
VACSNNPAPPLHAVYEQIARRLAPGGTLAVVGYPRLFGNTFEPDGLSPTGKGCNVGAVSVDRAFIGSSDVNWLNAKANQLNTTISDEEARAQQDLTAAGVDVTVKFIPVDNGAASVFNKHRIYDTGTPYFHALEFTDITPQQWSFHPNDNGQTAYAAAINAQL